MQQSLLQNKCIPHKQDVVAFDLDPLAELKNRYLCLKCLATPLPYRQSKIIGDAQQKFKEITISEFQNKKKLIKQSLDQLQDVQKQINELKEYFTNRISESTQILNQKILQVQNELSTLVEPSTEIQTEQDLINLSNYVNFGFNKNHNNQTSPKNFEFIDQIKQQLDYSKFEEYLMKITNQMEQLYTQSMIQEQVKLIPQNKLQIDQQEHQNLRYICQTHKSQITMIYLEPGQVEQRFFCQNCIKAKSYEQLKTIEDVNKLWQSHIQSVYIRNRNLYDLRQENQTKVNELIVQYQKCNQEFVNKLHKLIINQNNKIVKEINDSLSSTLNKQLYQMELKEIEFISQILSQHDPMQEIIQKRFQIQQEDKQYKEQLLEQLNLQRKKQMEIKFEISQLFQLDFSTKELKDDQMVQYFSKEQFPEFYENYVKFQNQYKKIICKVKSQFEKSQIQNDDQQLINQKQNKTLLIKKLLYQIQLIEKIWLKQVSLSTYNHNIELKFQIKRSSNNLTTQNIHVQQKYPIRRNLQLTINKIGNILNIENYQWFKWKKNLIFSNNNKHSSISLNNNNKTAYNRNNEQQNSTCICEQPILQIGSFAIDFKIKLLNNIKIGICNKQIFQQNYNFGSQSKHGYYVIDNSGIAYSHHETSKNNKPSGFSFFQGDIITIQVQQTTKKIIWKNEARGLSYSLEFQPAKDLHFCCVFYSQDNKQNEVEII